MDVSVGDAFSSTSMKVHQGLKYADSLRGRYLLEMIRLNKMYGTHEFHFAFVRNRVVPQKVHDVTVGKIWHSQKRHRPVFLGVKRQSMQRDNIEVFKTQCQFSILVKLL